MLTATDQNSTDTQVMRFDGSAYAPTRTMQAVRRRRRRRTRVPTRTGTIALVLLVLVLLSVVFYFGQV
jgi:hypothetical protein